LIKPSALGDVVHAMPVLSSLRRRWPGAHVCWVINRGLTGLVEGHPDLDEVIPFDRSRAGRGPAGLSSVVGFLRGLRKRRFDLAIDLQGLFRSGLMTWATGAPVRVGRADSREGAGLFYTHRIESGATHAVDRLLDLALAFGADVSRPSFRLPIRDDDRRWASETLSGIPRPLLVLNPGARWETKRWPPKHFAEVARRAILARGAGVVVVGAPEDRPLADAISSRLGEAGLSVLDLSGKTSLTGLAAVSAEADAVLSNDTGPLHVAVAAGARVVAVFTCTDPARTGPYGPEATVVRSGVWCAGSCIRTCDRLECMDELSPDRVWPVVDRVLRRTSSRVA